MSGGFPQLRAQWRKKIASFGVSERQADQETSRQEAWERKIYGAVYQSSTKQSLQQATDLGLRNYYSLLSQGNIPGAQQRLFELKNTLLLTDEQYQEYQAKGEAFLKKKQSDEYLANDPRRMVQDLDESLRTGQPVHGFTWRKDEAKSYRQRASAAIVQREVQSSYTTHQAVLKGELDDEASIRAAGGADLSERRIASLTQLAYHDPEYNSTALTQLRTAVRGFQPGSDRDQSKYDALQEQIERTVPRAMQSAFSDELHQAWQTRGQTTAATAQREQQAAYYRQIESLAHKGLLGSGEDPAALGMKTEFMKAEVERFIKAKPEANPAEVKEQIKNLAQQNGIQRQAAILLRNRGVAFSR